MRYRVGPEDQRIHPAEARRREPDPQRQRDGDKRRQSWGPAQAPHGVPYIVDEVRQPVNPPHVSHLLFALLQPVHRAQRRQARLFGRESVRDAFLDLVLQVELQLLFEFLFHLAPQQDGPEPQLRREPPVFDPHGSS